LPPSIRSTQLDINGVIDALDRERMVTLLAEPNLTAMSGETASFLAGGEFPIPISVENDRIGIEFKSFGVSLAFTPTILSEQRISLRVRPEVSQLSDNGSIKLGNLVIPALATRRAETTVELGSGQSFAIAGLLQNNTEQVAQSVPGLSQIPILGPLFRSDKYLRNESELVIIVTPYLVRPAGSPTRLALPTDGLVRPNDFERILAGNTYRPQIAGRRGGPRSAAGGALIGPAGFILE
jgi:pilus assembly protein CpaC